MRNGVPAWLAGGMGRAVPSEQACRWAHLVVTNPTPQRALGGTQAATSSLMLVTSAEIILRSFSPSEMTSENSLAKTNHRGIVTVILNPHLVPAAWKPGGCESAR